LKIGQHLAKLLARVNCPVCFLLTGYIHHQDIRRTGRVHLLESVQLEML